MGYKARITAVSNKSWEKSDERLSGNSDSKKMRKL